MADDFPKLRAAAVQAAPVFLDKEATIKKACHLIEEAADNGANLIVFSEAYIPTYPYWTFPEGMGLAGPWVRTWRDLLQNSVEIPSRDTDILCQAAQKAHAYIAMGLHEKDPITKGTMYNSILFLSKEGEIMGTHRKLIPIANERVYWGVGDGSGLKVFDTDFGKLSGLICAEHLMALPKYALWAKGEQVHCALWPGWPGGRHGGTKAVIDVASRYYAMAGQTFVIVASAYIREDLIPDDFIYKKNVKWNSFGGSSIINPMGWYLAGPAYDEETIVYADLDLGDIPLAKCSFDAVGHTARYDVININIDEERRVPYKTLRKEVAPAEYQELKRAVAELAAKLKEYPVPDLKTAAEDLVAKLGG